jgi:cyclopropane fatty-acyl-phospholipid synthase-like methyltransferase
MSANVIVKTDYPFCLDEPDFTLQGEAIVSADSSELKLKLKTLKMNCSAGEDDHTDKNLISESLSLFEKEKVNCLDLGCAGGQLILDYSQRPETDVCVGLDGSCGVYRHYNWSVEENRKILHHANLVEKFLIYNKDSTPLKFDIITCWEVIEHFNEDHLNAFFQNVTNHLANGGIFFGSIALFPDIRDINGYHQKCPEYNPHSEQFVLHKTVFDSRAPWDKILSKYFKVEEYDFYVRLRNHNNSYYFKARSK